MSNQTDQSERLEMLKPYAGQWVVWDQNRTRIIASGRSFAEADQAARTAGERDPVFEKVPDPNVRFIGGAI